MFFETVVLLGIKFHGIHNQLKLYANKLIPGRYRVPKFDQGKKTTSISL